MLEIICGVKGRGKTKVLLDQVNEAIRTANGNIVYLDKSSKHMYELNNRVRLINAAEYPLMNTDQFLGFICGIISQDNDLEEMYLDSFLTIAKLSEAKEAVSDAVSSMSRISDHFGVHIVLSISLDLDELPDSAKDKVVISV